MVVLVVYTILIVVVAQFMMFLNQQQLKKEKEKRVCPGESVCHGQSAASREAGQLSVAGLHLIWMSQRPT